MNILLDIIIAAILLISAFLGFKKGFVRSILGLFSTFASFIVAAIFSDSLASYLNKSFIFDSVRGGVFNRISESAGNAADPESLTRLLDADNSSLMNVLDKMGISDASIKEELSSLPDGSDAIGKISDFIASPIAKALSFAIAFIGLIIVSSIVLKILITVIDTIFKLPVLRGPNKLLGFAAGAVIGVIIVFFFVFAVDCLTPYFKAQSSNLINGIDPEKTALFSFFKANNPITGFFN